MKHIPIIGTSIDEHLRQLGFEPASKRDHYMMNAQTGNAWHDWYFVSHDKDGDKLTIIHLKRMDGQELRAELDILKISKVESKFIKPHVSQNMTLLSHNLQETLWRRAMKDPDEPTKSSGN
jgi:hypothetical protein